MDRRAFTQGLAWTVAVNLINKAIFPLFSIVISRILGPGPLGAFAILSTILMISEIFRDAGLTQTYLADKDLDRKGIGSYVGLAIVMALLPALVLVFARGWLAEVLSLPELPSSILVMFLALMCNGVATIPRAQLLKEAKMRDLAIIDLISGGTGLILTIILVLMGFAFWALVIQMLYCSALTMILSLRAAPLPGMNLERNLLLATFRRTAALLAANALNNIFLMSDVFVIRRLFASDALLGVFGQGKNIAYKPADFVTFPLTRMLIVAFSQAAGEKERLARAFGRSVAATMLFVTPIYLLLMLAAKPIIGILLGPKFAGSAPILAVMSVFLAFRTLGTIGGTALVSDGKAKLTLWAQVAGLSATVIALVWLGPRLLPPTYRSVADFREVRGAEIGAQSSRLAQQAKYSVVESPVVTAMRPAQWVVFVLPDRTRAAELIDLVSFKVVDRGTEAAGYSGPKTLPEIAGTERITYPLPVGMYQLLLVAWSFCIGAVVLYGLALAIAFHHYPAGPDEKRKIGLSSIASVLTGLAILCINLMPATDLLRLLATVILAPVFHILIIGVVFAKHPFAYFSLEGLKKLWHSL